MGANEVLALNDPTSGSRNLDMNVVLKNGWPLERGNANWLHGDFRSMSYLYVCPLYDKVAEIGGLE